MGVILDAAVTAQLEQDDPCSGVILDAAVIAQLEQNDPCSGVILPKTTDARLARGNARKGGVTRRLDIERGDKERRRRETIFN